MNTVHVNLGPRSYDLVITSDDLGGLGAHARQRARGKLACVVTDQHVLPHAAAVSASLSAAGFSAMTVTLQPGETHKNLETVSTLFDRLVDVHADRNTLIVPVGGGVVGDVAGFVAATYNRGVPLFMVPTTLLAMVDSSVGGKVGVNHPKVKNVIGAFHQPLGVWIDTALLATLPDREYRSGLAEVVKYGAILDAELFGYLETHADDLLARQPEAVRHIVTRSCQLKASVVEKDEREETGLRSMLNYGHTFAHAFETVAGYGTWLHGEAVAAGMVCACKLAERRGLIGPELTLRMQRLLVRLRLPTKPDCWTIDDVVATMRNDKKSLAGRLRFVLPKQLGEVAIVDGIPELEVWHLLEEFCT